MHALFNRPLLMEPRAAGLLATGWTDAMADLPGFGWTDEAGYSVVDGVAVIGVLGTLMQRTGSKRPIGCLDWFLTGYDGIAANLDQALDDAAVRAIVLAVDSPGGMVAGCPDLAEAIFAARARKPIAAICAENACSAAYFLAAATMAVSVPATGVVGSIGAVAMHADISGALEKAGIRVTLIQRGARKTDGAEVKPLSDQALAGMQAEIDQIGELFEAAIARYRGLPVDQVRATEAAVFMGQDGVDRGLADYVLAPDRALAELIDRLN